MYNNYIIITKMEKIMRGYSDVAVVGAGASGLLCSQLLAAGGMQVTVFEKNNRIGKKLSATGNGRCNFTNYNMSSERYYGEKDWIEKVLSAYTPGQAVERFEKLGVYHRERDGYVYPYTNQASTVVESLEKGCASAGVEIVLDCKVSGIRWDAARELYRVNTKAGEIRCRYVILATGGRASAELGGDGSGYKIARSLGHEIRPVYPGLTGLRCEGRLWNQVAGTRIQGRFSLIAGREQITGECGEIQIVKDGVSGIPVFQLCRVAAEALSKGSIVEGVINFVPPMSEEELKDWIRVHGIDGLVPKKWAAYMRKRPEPEKLLKQFRFQIRETFGMERAQVSAGGVSLQEVDPDTMESALHENLFLMGELLDVDGKCGGYNLHMAWAGAEAAAREILRRNKSLRNEV